MIGITSYGAYIPYHRLPRSVIGAFWGQAGGRGEKAICNYDEDSLTMAMAAATDCLTSFDPKKVDGLFLATTTSPYKERQGSAIVATALDLRRDIRAGDFTNCLRSGTIALASALDAISAGTAKSILVTTADSRLGAAQGELEQAVGDGAACLMLGDTDVAVIIEGSFTLTDDFVDFWRAADDTFVRSWEDRFGLDEGYRKILPEAVSGVLQKCNLSPKDFAKAVFYGPNERRHREMGRRLGFEPSQVQDPLFATVGNTGAALAFMILIAALEEAKPGDRILLASYGNGADALVLRVTEEIEKIRDRRGIKRNLESKRTIDSYGRYLRWRELVPLERAARPEMSPVSISALWRDRRNILALYGLKCRRCSTPQLFMSGQSTQARVCIACQAKDDFDDYLFADKKATIFTFTQDLLAAAADPPNTTTVVDFEGGGRGIFQMTDREPEEVKVGMPVEMSFRKLYFDRGIHNYFWKTRPVRG